MSETVTKHKSTDPLQTPPSTPVPSWRTTTSISPSQPPGVLPGDQRQKVLPWQQPSFGRLSPAPSGDVIISAPRWAVYAPRPYGVGRGSLKLYITILLTPSRLLCLATIDGGTLYC